tara:strand:+ start:634 stop:738 length:105 start_codon:yes stop_codon:yes gene_type:complete
MPKKENDKEKNIKSNLVVLIVDFIPKKFLISIRI